MRHTRAETACPDSFRPQASFSPMKFDILAREIPGKRHASTEANIILADCDGWKQGYRTCSTPAQSRA
jgi:hypothetical protein